MWSVSESSFSGNVLWRQPFYCRLSTKGVVINYWEGGYKTEGGGVKLYPYKKGGGGVLEILKGGWGTTSFWVVFRNTTRLTEVCGKVLSEKYAYKSVVLLLSNVIDADHQIKTAVFFTKKGHFPLPLWVIISVLAKFIE